MVVHGKPSQFPGRRQVHPAGHWNLSDLRRAPHAQAVEVVPAVLKSHEVLGYVLEAVLKPPVPIRAITVADPAVLRNDVDEKQIVFDVRVVLEDGSEIIVEMQCSPTRGFRDRLVYYAARGLVGQLEPGDKYHELEPSIVYVTWNQPVHDEGLIPGGSWLAAPTRSGGIASHA